MAKERWEFFINCGEFTSWNKIMGTFHEQNKRKGWYICLF